MTTTTTETPAQTLARLPIARTGPARAAFARCIAAAEGAATRGWIIRKGSAAPSARRSTVYIYATPTGGDERRIWEEETRFGGFNAPLTGPRLAHLESALAALA
jgi:hypothetical protein